MATTLEDADDPVKRTLHFPCGAEMHTPAERGEPIEEHTCPECGTETTPEATDAEPTDRWRQSHRRLSAIYDNEATARELVPDDDALPDGWTGTARHTGGGIITFEFRNDDERKMITWMKGDANPHLFTPQLDEHGHHCGESEYFVTTSHGTFEGDADAVAYAVDLMEQYNDGRFA